ncbi:MAG TPA: DUF4386 family protein [Nitrospiraceae bacterium]|nr:DUF4386 family protein [Nitrospiraceae bacterium]
MGNKTGSIAAIAGALLLLVGTFLHPLGADPKDPLGAFTEYAADRFWITSHLMQLTGVVLMVFALVVLSRVISSGDDSPWAHIGVVGAGASLSVAAALQAVDGVALKAMVDRWAAAPAAEKEMLFHATFAVRQIEVGLAGILSLLFGITATIYGVALLSSRHFPRWLGWLPIGGGIPTALAGVVIAYTGFSGVAMGINASASPILLVWMILVGVRMWRL